MLSGLLAWTVSLASPAWSDTTLHYRQEADGQDTQADRLDVYIKDGRIALVGGAGDDVTHRVWFDSETRRITILDPEAGGYYRLDEASAGRLQSAHRVFRDRIDKRIAGHDRADIAEALSLVRRIEAREFGGGYAPAIEIRPDSTQTREAHPCRSLGVYRTIETDSQRVRTLCIVDVEAVVDNPADVRTLDMLGATSRRIASTVSAYAERLPDIGIDLSVGLPLRIVHLDGMSSRTLVLDSVVGVAVDEAIFAVPAEFDRPLSLRGAGSG